MLPLDAIKAPQGKKTLGLRQNRPAQGMGHREVALQPGPWDPPTPESRGNAHPGSEQERKRHCADRGGSFRHPQGGERTC